MKKHGNSGADRDEHMMRLKAEHDLAGTAYPAELTQYLLAKSKKTLGEQR